MKRIHFDVEEDGFYGAYWACKDMHTAAGTDSIQTCATLSDTILLYRTYVLFPLGGYSFAVSSLQLHPVFGGISK